MSDSPQPQFAALLCFTVVSVVLRLEGVMTADLTSRLLDDRPSAVDPICSDSNTHRSIGVLLCREYICMSRIVTGGFAFGYQCIVRCTRAKAPTDVILINDLAVVEMERRKEN